MLLNNAKNVKPFLYRKTHLRQNKLLPQNLVLIQGNNSFSSNYTFGFWSPKKINLVYFLEPHKIINNFVGGLNPEA